MQVTKPFRQVGRDELLQQILRVRVDVRGVLDASAQDIFVDFERGAAVPEGSEATEHFEDENAERPPGKTLSVLLSS